VLKFQQKLIFHQNWWNSTKFRIWSNSGSLNTNLAFKTPKNHLIVCNRTEISAHMGPKFIISHFQNQIHVRWPQITLTYWVFSVLTDVPSRCNMGWNLSTREAEIYVFEFSRSDSCSMTSNYPKYWLCTFLFPLKIFNVNVLNTEMSGLLQTEMVYLNFQCHIRVQWSQINLNTEFHSISSILMEKEFLL